MTRLPNPQQSSQDALRGAPIAASLPVVLVISSDVDGGELYCMMLESANVARGVRVRGLHGAVRRLRERPACAAVIYDVMRPSDWSDCEMLARSRGVPPVIVITGWIRPDGRFRTRAFEAGCAAFIAKPCHSETLRDVLGRVLAGERGLERLA